MPDPPAHQLEDVGDHPDGRRLAVRAGHRDDRDAGRRAGREQQVDDRPRDVLRLALGRVGVHPEAGRRVDLDDARRRSRGRASVMSGQMKSMPAMSRPTIRAAVSAISTLSGWASIVRSIEVPPVDMLPVSASLTQVPGGRDRRRARSPAPATSSSAASSSLIRVSTFSWPMPRRGSRVGDVDQLADGVLAVAGDATPGRAPRPPRPCRR